MSASSPTPQRSYARVFVRTKCDLPIQLTYARDGKDVVVATRCTNVCVGGFFADLPDALAIDQSVVLEFLPAGSSQPVRVNAEVRHIHGHETGFQFLDISEADHAALRRFFAMSSDKEVPSPASSD